MQRQGPSIVVCVCVVCHNGDRLAKNNVLQMESAEWTAVGAAAKTVLDRSLDEGDTCAVEVVGDNTWPSITQSGPRHCVQLSYDIHVNTCHSKVDGRCLGFRCEHEHTTLLLMFVYT